MICLWWLPVCQAGKGELTSVLDHWCMGHVRNGMSYIIIAGHVG